jgi:ubiquinone/menaquinone biosynthesis C-methylase UbiE
MNTPERTISPNSPTERGETDQPFDAVAQRYDRDFSHTPIGLYKRGIVHRYLESVVTDGMSVLELNCGTGIDALWLASKGCHVTATDASEGMLDVARERIISSAAQERVRFRTMRIEELADPDVQREIGRVDMIFSDFDGINALEKIDSLAKNFSNVLNPNGSVLLVYMNPFCTLEVIGNLLRLRPTRAFARFRSSGVMVHIGEGRSMQTWFHPVRDIMRTFSKEYDLLACRAVGLLVPPTSMRGVIDRHPSLIERLAPFDERLSKHFPFNRMGDNVLLHFRIRENG